MHVTARVTEVRRQQLCALVSAVIEHCRKNARGRKCQFTGRRRKWGATEPGGKVLASGVWSRAQKPVWVQEQLRRFMYGGAKCLCLPEAGENTTCSRGLRREARTGVCSIGQEMLAPSLTNRCLLWASVAPLSSARRRLAVPQDTTQIITVSDSEVAQHCKAFALT